MVRNVAPIPTPPLRLRASEIRFWQDVYVAWVRANSTGPKACEGADKAVERLRDRIETPEPIAGGPYREHGSRTRVSVDQCSAPADDCKAADCADHGWR